MTALFHDLPLSRKKEAASVAAHFITGVLARDELSAIFASLLREAVFAPGDRVKTFKGTLRGTVVKILDDGRLKWRTEAGTELIALPESLLPDE